jgi:hypothetical protein
MNKQLQVALTRDTIMSTALSYCNAFHWTCTSANLASPQGWTKPRYIGSAGNYSSMPYCWGGFSSTTAFSTGLANGGRVGNINTSTSAGVSNTFGLDCSGYGSKCRGLSSHYGTGQLGQVSQEISWSALQKGDALLNAGSHVMLYSTTDTYGNYIVYESTMSNGYDRVLINTRSATGLTSYTPMKCDRVW